MRHRITARAASVAGRTVGVTIAVATILAIASEAQGAPNGGIGGGILQQNPENVVILTMSSAEVASTGARVVSTTATAVRAEQAAAQWAARSTTYGNIAGRLGNLVMYYAIFADGVEALEAAYDYDNPENWNNYVAGHQENINDAAFFWNPESWNGILDNPLMSFMGMTFNPVGTVSASVANLAQIVTDVDATISIAGQAQASRSLLLATLDRATLQQQQRIDNQSWIQTATVAELQSERSLQIAGRQARQSYLTWAERELEKWWWQRSGSASQIEEEIRRTRRQIELFNLTIAAIEAELTSRGEVIPW